MMAIEKVVHRPPPHRLEIDWGDSRYCLVSYRKAYFAGKQGLFPKDENEIRQTAGEFRSAVTAAEHQ